MVRFAARQRLRPRRCRAPSKRYLPGTWSRGFRRDCSAVRRCVPMSFDHMEVTGLHVYMQQLAPAQILATLRESAHD